MKIHHEDTDRREASATTNMNAWRANGALIASLLRDLRVFVVKDFASAAD